MCFSATADVVAGIVVGALGLDVATHLRGRREYRALAALPLLFAAHQLVESLVWWGAEGSVPHRVASVALWVYLLFAFVVLPTYVPWATWCIEPPGTRRRLMAATTGLGAGVSVVLLAAMLTGPVTVTAHRYHLAYSTALPASTLVVALYVLATCGAFLFSGEPLITWFGAVNLVAVAVIAVVTVDGLASVWCGWAAVTSGAFAAYLRQREPQLFVEPSRIST
jgi:hypothetical protein